MRPEEPDPTDQKWSLRESRQRGSVIRDLAAHAVRSRRVFPYLAGATLVLTIGTGFLVRLVDRRDFHSVGDGIWWAVVTLATVGYGDIVPTTTWGRVIGTAVIIFGVTFLAFLTATVTSLFVSSEQQTTADLERQERLQAEAETRAILLRMERRLSDIESKLDRGA